MNFQLGQRYVTWVSKTESAVNAVIVQVVALDRSHVTVQCVQTIGHIYTWKVNELIVCSHEHMVKHFEYMQGQDHPE